MDLHGTSARDIIAGRHGRKLICGLDGTTSDYSEIARAYFDGLHRKDLSAVPYAEDAVMWSPVGPDGLAEPIRGRDAIVRCLEGVLPVLGSVEIKTLFAQGEWAAGRAFIKLRQPAGALLRTDDLFRIEDGNIVEQESSWR